jgi:hypothetical protein
VYRNTLPPAEFDSLVSQKRIREAAFMLALGQTGVEFDEGVVAGMWDDVASAAAEFFASPDVVQQALEVHEPSLAVGVE